MCPLFRVSIIIEVLLHNVIGTFCMNVYIIGGDGGVDEEEEVLTLPREEQRELELQFTGSIIEFSNLTVDTDNCLGQGSYTIG